MAIVYYTAMVHGDSIQFMSIVYGVWYIAIIYGTWYMVAVYSVCHMAIECGDSV